MSNNIVGRNSSELEDFSKQFESRKDFTLYGTIEKISEKFDSVKVKLFDKDKQGHGVGFNITENFNVEALKEAESPLLAFTAKIETFLGKEKRYVTKVTLTNGTEVEEEPESTLLTLENININDALATDQKGLYLVHFKVPNGDSEEYYHMRWYNKDHKEFKLTPVNISFKLSLTKHQIDEHGVRKTGIESYSYEKEGETISGKRSVYKICLNLESIDYQ